MVEALSCDTLLHRRRLSLAYANVDGIGELVCSYRCLGKEPTGKNLQAGERDVWCDVEQGAGGRDNRVVAFRHFVGTGGQRRRDRQRGLAFLRSQLGVDTGEGKTVGFPKRRQRVDGDLQGQLGDGVLEAQNFVEVEFADYDVCAVGEPHEP